MASSFSGESNVAKVCEYDAHESPPYPVTSAVSEAYCFCAVWKACDLLSRLMGSDVKKSFSSSVDVFLSEALGQHDCSYSFIQTLPARYHVLLLVRVLHRFSHPQSVATPVDECCGRSTQLYCKVLKHNCLVLLLVCFSMMPWDDSARMLPCLQRDTARVVPLVFLFVFFIAFQTLKVLPHLLSTGNPVHLLGGSTECGHS